MQSEKHQGQPIAQCDSGQRERKIADHSSTMKIDFALKRVPVSLHCSGKPENGQCAKSEMGG
jgi:hypothetical protein